MLRTVSRVLMITAVLAWLAVPARAATSTLPKCHMTFTLKGWSAVYKTAHGRGEITCTDGESMPVVLTVTGGGLTFGKMDVLKGKGDFSAAKSIQEVLGKYVAAEATAGAVKSGEAAVYTKGEISLALAGTGRGVGVGIDFGQLDIEPAHK